MTSTRAWKSLTSLDTDCCYDDNLLSPTGRDDYGDFYNRVPPGFKTLKRVPDANQSSTKQSRKHTLSPKQTLGDGFSVDEAKVRPRKGRPETVKKRKRVDPSPILGPLELESLSQEDMPKAKAPCFGQPNPSLIAPLRPTAKGPNKPKPVEIIWIETDEPMLSDSDDNGYVEFIGEREAGKRDEKMGCEDGKSGEEMNWEGEAHGSLPPLRRPQVHSGSLFVEDGHEVIVL